MAAASERIIRASRSSSSPSVLCKSEESEKKESRADGKVKKMKLVGGSTSQTPKIRIQYVPVVVPVGFGQDPAGCRGVLLLLTAFALHLDQNSPDHNRSETVIICNIEQKTAIFTYSRQLSDNVVR